MKKHLLRGLVLLSILGALPLIALADTRVTADITGNTTWSAVNSPYIVDSPTVTIYAGSTLTIEPGVVVKFAQGSELFNYGRVIAHGTVDKPIYFTSLLDDSLGGDTNMDGSSTQPAPYNYWDISVSGRFASFDADYVSFSYGGYPLNFSGSNNNSLSHAVFSHVLTGIDVSSFSTVTINNSVFESDIGEDPGIMVSGDAMVFVANSTIRGFKSGIESKFSDIEVKDSVIENNTIGINFPNPPMLVVRPVNKALAFIQSLISRVVPTVFASTFHTATISNTSIVGNHTYGVYKDFLSTTVVDAKNNWWGDVSGPRNISINPAGIGDVVSDDVSFAPWLTSVPNRTSITVCTVNCYSNILFFPGIMGSRLYENNGSEKELWVTTSDADQADLTLDAQGKSTNTVYTKDDTKNTGEIDETGIVDDVYNFNIYQSFISDLKNWKQDGTIADYDFIPYDWRLSLDDIITNGATSTGNISYTNSQNFSESYIVKKLQELVDSSKSGKVTIIAHSNGGLVTKALIQKLKDTNNPLYDKIDKIIFVAVPQVGTPEAVLDLLHGTTLGYIIMSNERSRQLAENMPMTYNLLPSTSYFSMVNQGFVLDTIASFENDPVFNPQISQYGFFVSNPTEQKNFILGTDGRSKPMFGDTDNPNIGNSNLYTQAEQVHQILDNWQPSPNTKVIQVAGWGEDTLSGIDYESVSVYGEGLKHTTFKPRWVVDGDGTVVVPSALWMSTSTPNVERWWVDLRRYDTISNLQRVHKDIFEVSNLLSFILSQITSSVFNDVENIVVNSTQTLISHKARLHYTLHSPLTLGVTDDQGRYTGQDPITRQIREEIPSVTYKKIGDVQFLSAPSDIAFTLKLQGYTQGSFALDVDKQQGNTITESTSFQGIPSSATTQVTMDIIPNQVIASSTLEIDQNGDGTIDNILPATPSGTTLYDMVPPEISITFSTSTKGMLFLGVDSSPVMTTQTSTSTIATDNQGNRSVLNFTKFKEKTTELRFVFDTIVRNAVLTTFPNTSVEYNWGEKDGVLTDLDTKVIIKGVEKYKFEYKKSTNTTIMKEKINLGVIKTTRNGFVIVTVSTQGNDVKISY